MKIKCMKTPQGKKLLLSDWAAEPRQMISDYIIFSVVSRYFALVSVIKLLGHYPHKKVHKMCTSSTKMYFISSKHSVFTNDNKIPILSLLTLLMEMQMFAVQHLWNRWLLIHLLLPSNFKQEFCYLHIPCPFNCNMNQSMCKVILWTSAFQYLPHYFFSINKSCKSSSTFSPG